MTALATFDRDFFRRNAGELTASYARLFGAHHLDLAERVADRTLRRAFRRWPYHGLPADPRAWLHAEALRQAHEILIREGTVRSRILLLLQEFLPVERKAPATTGAPEPAIAEDELKLLFLCCHPLIAKEARIPHLLKSLGGWGNHEIGLALDINGTKLERLIADARRKIRARRLPLQFPSGAEREARVALVASTLHELHCARGAESELGAEAMHLAQLWGSHAQGQEAAAHALLAFFHLRKGASRSTLRVGLDHLELAAQSGPLSFLHLLAGRAACGLAQSQPGGAPAGRVLTFYDALFALSDTPGVALDRATAFLGLLGETAGRKALKGGAGSVSMALAPLLAAAEAELFRRRGDAGRAREGYRIALNKADTSTARRFLMKRLNEG